MSEDAAPALEQARQWPWRRLLCMGSLALNLLLGGAIAAHLLIPERIERMTSGPHSQILPRRFFADLAPERRRELLGVLKSYRPAFQAGRRGLNAASLKLADALEAEPYQAAAVEAAVAAFAQAGTGMMDTGGKAALDALSRLDAGERRLLAKRLRERGSRRR